MPVLLSPDAPPLSPDAPAMSPDEIETSPSAGGGATFMLTGDPFAANPFADPFGRDRFAEDKFLPMPRKKG